MTAIRHTLTFLLLLTLLVNTGCQIAITCVKVYPGEAPQWGDLQASAAMPDNETVSLTDNSYPGLSVNQSLYKSNAGKANNVNQKTDANTSATIPASILGSSNTKHQ